MGEIKIYSYSNYREFLKDMYNELKTENPAFSYRYFSKRAGFASPNFLKLVMDEKRNLTPESIHKFSEGLKLGKKERQFFELLVYYNQTEEAKQKQHYYQQILEFPEYRKVHHFEKEQYAYLSQWYYPAILELIQLSNFQEDPKFADNNVGNQVSIREAKEALDVLLEIGFMKRNEGGNLVPAHPHLTTGEEARSLASFSFHEQVLEKAKVALNQQKSEEREFAAITMALNKKQLNRIKEMIRD